MNHLTICIPTYNRIKSLKINLDMLITFIKDLNLTKYINIVISDNATKDFYKFAQEYEDINFLDFIINTDNLGPEQNFVNLIQYSLTDWVMLLGDDDYINKDYLSLVFHYIQDKEIYTILPNFYQVDGNRNIIRNKRMRDKMKEDRFIEKGDLKYMFLAHQVSGIVFRKNNVIEAYTKNTTRNLYCQMFFVGYNLVRGGGVHITRFPLENTVIKNKSVNYDIDNLLDHVLDNIKGLNINQEKKRELYIFIIKHDTKSRLGCLYSQLHPQKMLYKIRKYDVSNEIKNYIKWRFIISYLYFPVNLVKYVLNIYKEYEK